MSSDWVIRAQGLGKCYSLFARPLDRLKLALQGRQRSAAKMFWALQDVDFHIPRGEVFGIVGRNGAGKSTLLQLISGILQPSTGSVTVQGRVAALLELGSGFNPEFTGRENVFMNGAILGLKRDEIEARLDAILAFADIGQFIDQPVKTYSSGMFMRLAFSIATSVDPAILIIDEALSVGDGAFARKSFDRIMQLKEAGKTVLMCSHSMYHIEAVCNRVLWLEGGQTRQLGSPAAVLPAYSLSLEAPVASSRLAPSAAPAPPGSARLVSITALVDGVERQPLLLLSGQSTLTLRIAFASDPQLPAPGIGIGIDSAAGTVVATANSYNDGFQTHRDERGQGMAEITFPRLALLRGHYRISIFLTCERVLHVYEQAVGAIAFDVEQSWLEPGLVTLPHAWHDV
ncbi:MAG: ABC transporter ATP-binding protein [Burkholderiales bacterium]